MSKEISTNEQLFNALVNKSKEWVRIQAESIRDNFPTLPDNTKGLQVGWSATAMYAKVLRPDGVLVFVDLTRVGEAKEPDKLLKNDDYLSRNTLFEVQRAVDKIKSALNKEKSKPTALFKVGNILTRR